MRLDLQLFCGVVRWCGSNGWWVAACKYLLPHLEHLHLYHRIMHCNKQMLHQPNLTKSNLQ
jgi:hypothetical protein